MLKNWNHYIRFMSIPLISIVTPFKNTAEFLPACLDSIINQTYTNWELLIVDDHSTDASYNIVLEYAQKDKRIKLFKNKSKGIISALQLAFIESEGDYITRMDSDDIMYPEKLELLLKNLLRKGKQNIAIGLVKYFNESGLKEGYRKYEKWLNSLTKHGINYSQIYKECVIPSPCWMLHRDDLIACGAFDSDRYPEDYDLAFRCYQHKFQCIPCDTKLHHWRDYSTRTSRTDEQYSDNRFIDIKLHYFLKLDWDKNRTLVIWGAGKKGKQLAKLLIDRHINFEWICDNPKKIGKHIYNKEMHNFSYLAELQDAQSIISVANSEAQKEIKSYFEKNNKRSMIDYFFFC